ncbi:hypothetical protein CROQUDRAFT_717635 [Cronartium quercuum f. sp. fusiforme G11]|uniref:Secreted protein n=1 Tax=Cronartium quercuum f. sp. fusiforme G11 TaxID=708437 RepID=A0A9P6NE84_9BASI|nr:hypothetical protein CROQUDRAFT_717635 [Cronartium quercuum f. sp. fusiforme G11]
MNNLSFLGLFIVIVAFLNVPFASAVEDLVTEMDLLNIEYAEAAPVAEHIENVDRIETADRLDHVLPEGTIVPVVHPVDTPVTDTPVNVPVVHPLEITGPIPFAEVHPDQQLPTKPVDTTEEGEHKSH